VDQRHADYVAYYRARMQRYQGDPLYPRSAAAERDLYEAIHGCATLDDFRTVIETDHPEVKCAIARVLDQEQARAEHFRAIAETVRARGPAQIVEAAASVGDVAELNRVVGEISNRNSIEISVDGFVDEFHHDFKILEDLEVDQAILDEVPSEWRSELAEHIAYELERGRQHYQEHTLPEARNWAPGWELDHALVWEERHRRRIPEPDAVVSKRIEQHLRYLGRK